MKIHWPATDMQSPRRTIPHLRSPAQLDWLELIRSPAWILALEPPRVWWINQAALDLWQVTSLETVQPDDRSAIVLDGIDYARAVPRSESFIAKWRLVNSLVEGRGYCTPIHIEEVDVLSQESNSSSQTHPGSSRPALLIEAIAPPQGQRERLLHRQAEILEKIATDAPLREVLTSLVLALEEQFGDAVGSVLLVQDDRLYYGAAPNLPPELQALDGIEIAEGRGSCGTAAYRRQSVVVTDIASDPLWQDFRQLALPHGLEACWSVPIISHDHRVLGTFALYYLHKSAPHREHWQPMAMATHLARMAIERQQIQTTLRESERRFRELFEQIPNIPVQGYDLNRRVIFWNHASEKLYGYTRQEALSRRLEDLIIPPEMREQVVRSHRAWLEGNQPVPAEELELQHKDGYRVPVFSSHVMLRNVSGEAEMYCVDLDLTEYKRVEAALRESEIKYRQIFENIAHGIFQIAPEGHFISANPFLARLYGYESPESLIAQLTDIERQLYVDPSRRGAIVERIEQEGAVYSLESEVYRRDGTRIWISETQQAIRDEQGNLLYYQGTVEDITPRKLAEDKLKYEALHDPLTGLPNRAYFMQLLAGAIGNPGSAVLFIDIDRFKSINDSLGHLVGDEFLRHVAARLRTGLSSQAIVARVGGDEFAILVQNCQTQEEAVNVAASVESQLTFPFHYRGYEMYARASIGIVVGLGSYQQPEEPLRDADLAMYRAKTAGGGRWEIFSPPLQQQALRRWQMENDLRGAIAAGELSVYYQPIVAIATGEIIGLEALLRWQHPRWGWVSPGEFIPIAEETGLIHPIGWWTLEQAVAQLCTWRDNFAIGLVIVNVNLSVIQLQHSDLVDRLGSLLSQSQLEGSELKLEITESCFLESLTYAADHIQRLRELGVGLCIDDFGTGYSSLSRLHQFPVDTLKIDRSFVRGLGTGNSDTAIAQTIVTLGTSLGMNVVAEGIETEAQRLQLQQLGCLWGQGFLFSRPASAEQITVLLERGKLQPPL